jgi:hypothetical protein
MLTIVDEFTRECLAIDVSRKLTSEDVLERLSDLFVRKGVPDHIRSDNGSEFTAKRVREWLARVGVKTLYIEPGSPWENGYVESFNGKLRDELLDREVFDTLLEAKVLIGRWRKAYNTVRPHSSLGYRPPAPESHRPCQLVISIIGTTRQRANLLRHVHDVLRPSGHLFLSASGVSNTINAGYARLYAEDLHLTGERHTYLSRDAGGEVLYATCRSPR